MKKTFTFEVKRKIQWPRTRCPECGSGWIEFWHLIDADEEEWTVQCPYCGLSTEICHTKRDAWKAWKEICKGKVG